MQLILPAMPCRQGQRTDYTTVLSYKELEKLSILCDFTDKPIEEKYQRPLNPKRIKALATYVHRNFDNGYILPSLVLGINSEAIEYRKHSDAGELKINLDAAQISIHDGQHRWHGLLEALKKAKGIGLDRYKHVAQDELLVQFVVSPTLEHSRQIFADINGYAKPSNKSLNLLFDQRHPYNDINHAVWRAIPVFYQFVEVEKGILVKNKIWFYSNLCGANKIFLDGLDLDINQKIEALVIYWQAVSNNINIWTEILEANSTELILDYKRNTIAISGLLLYSLALVGKKLYEQFEVEWNKETLDTVLSGLSEVHWWRNNPDYLKFCIHPKELKLLSSRNAKESLAEYLLNHLEV